MATYSKITLSESTDGRGILVDDAASAGKAIHTGSSTATTYDEIWLYAANYDTSDRKLTIEWGSASAGDLIEQTITTEAGLVLVVPGLLLKVILHLWWFVLLLLLLVLSKSLVTLIE